MKREKIDRPIDGKMVSDVSMPVGSRKNNHDCQYKADP